GRTAAAGAVGASARAGVEIERHLTGSPEAAKTVKEAWENIWGSAEEQAKFQAIGETIGYPFVKGGERLSEEEEIATKLLNRRVTRKELFDWGRKRGIDMTAAEVAGGGFAELVQHLAETSLLGIATAKAAYERGHKATQSLIQLIRDTVGAGGMTDVE